MVQRTLRHSNTSGLGIVKLFKHRNGLEPNLATVAKTKLANQYYDYGVICCELNVCVSWRSLFAFGYIT